MSHNLKLLEQGCANSINCFARVTSENSLPSKTPRSLYFSHARCSSEGGGESEQATIAVFVGPKLNSAPASLE